MRRWGIGLGSLVVATLGLAAACGEETNERPPAGADAGMTEAAALNDGAASDRGPVPPPTNGPIDPAVAARAAVVLASCFTEFEAESVLDQMYSRKRLGLSDYRGLATCIDSRRNGCAAITDCTGVVSELTGPCERRCDGTVAEACDDQLKTRVDCSFNGRTCTKGEKGAVGCTELAALACDPASPTARRCGADGRPITCRAEREEHGPSCADLGMTCVDDQCAGGEGSCQAVSNSGDQVVYEAVSCNGTKLTACVGNGLTTFDCSKHITGATCQALAVDGGTKSYCGLAAECKPGDPAQAACDGDNVVVCNGGRIDRVDCKSLGFTGCVASKTYAFCTPSLKATALAMQDGGF
jgi:hypothetical protein